MAGMITVRLDGPWGRQRLELSLAARLGDLRTLIESRTGVATAQQVLSLHRTGTDALPLSGGRSRKECNVHNGTQIFLRVAEQRPEAAAPAVAAAAAEEEAEAASPYMFVGSGCASAKCLRMLE